MVGNRSSMMFLPNPKGTIRRDNDRRQKAHRTALESIRGDVDSSQPKSVRFSRVVDLKKARQEDDRIDYVEKCNRKLVAKMMLIMQGLGGTVVTEQNIQDFNPGTLNRSLRRREMHRINRDNLALMHRIEKASSDYKPKLLEPKHFQMPHMGLFPRVSDSVKFVGKRSKDRGEKASQRKRKRAQSSPGYSLLGLEESVTSSLTEPSNIHQLRSTVAARRVRPISGGKDVEEAKESDVPESEDEGVDLVNRTTEWTPQPPPASLRTTCAASTSYGTTRSKQRSNKLLNKPLEVRPGPVVYHGGVKVGDDYMVLSVTRHGGKNPNELDGDGRIMFRLQVYSPTLLTIYSLEISAKRLPAFTLGNRTAAREMFYPGQRSRRLWENVAACLELKTPTPPSPTGTDTERDEQMGEVDSKSEMDDPTTEMTSKPMVRKSTVDNIVLANATGNATSKLVLVPPPEASIVAIQRIFRGLQTRRKYDVLKSATIFIQVTTRLWRERTRRRKHAAASKITSLVQRRQERIREQKRIAAAKIQEKSQAWVRRRKCAKSEAAKKIQSMFRERQQTSDRALCGGMAGEEPRKTSPLRCRTSPRGPSPVTPRGNGSVRSRGVALEEVKNACHEAQYAKLAGRGEHISPEKPLIFSPLHGGSSGKSETSSDIKYTADVGLLCGKTLTGSPLARNSMRPRPPDTKNMTRSSFYPSGRGRAAGRNGSSPSGDTIIAHPHLVLVTPVALAGSSHPNRNMQTGQKGPPRSFPKPPGKTLNSPLSLSVHDPHNRAGMSNRAVQQREMERSHNALHHISLAARSPAPRAGRIVRVTPVATSNKTDQGEESHADGRRHFSAQDSDINKPLSRERRAEPKVPPSSDQSDCDGHQSDYDGQECKLREGNDRPDTAAIEEQHLEKGDKTPSSSTSMKPEAGVKEWEEVVEPAIAVEQGDPEEGAKANESVDPPTKTIASGVKLRRSVSWAGGILTSEMPPAYDATPPKGSLEEGANSSKDIEQTTQAIPSDGELRRYVSSAEDTLAKETSSPSEGTFHHDGSEEGAKASESAEQTTETIASSGNLRRSVSWAEDILVNKTPPQFEATCPQDDSEEGTKASDSVEQTMQILLNAVTLRSSISRTENLLAIETSPSFDDTLSHGGPENGPENGAKACESVEQSTKTMRRSVSWAEDILVNETPPPFEATCPQDDSEEGAKASDSVEQTMQILLNAVTLRSSISRTENLLAIETSPSFDATLSHGGPENGPENGAKACESVEQSTRTMRRSVSWAEDILSNETSPPSEATLPQGGSEQSVKGNESVEQSMKTIPSVGNLPSSVSWADDTLAIETSSPSEAILHHDGTEEGAKACKGVNQTMETKPSGD